MKILSYKTYIPLLFLMLITAELASAQKSSVADTTAKGAKKWAKSRAWANGLPTDVYTDVNALEFAKQYHANKAWWDAAFIFMRDKDLATLPAGKYQLAGDNVVATITNSVSKTFEKSGWESHRKVIDLQYIIRGKEKIGVAPLAGATVIKPYDETSDVANYTAEGKYYIATPKEFFLFFPTDLHRPNIKVDGFDTVKKLVIKIRVSPSPLAPAN